MFQCNNCPAKPQFPTLDELTKHWTATHTVPMVETITDPWGERPPRVIRHFEEIKP
jgi:hypothetical protein